MDGQGVRDWLLGLPPFPSEKGTAPGFKDFDLKGLKDFDLKVKTRVWP